MLKDIFEKLTVYACGFMECTIPFDLVYQKKNQLQQNKVFNSLKSIYRNILQTVQSNFITIKQSVEA